MSRLVLVLAISGFGCGSVQTESCPGLEPPDNGSVSAPVTDVGAAATYRCAAGFVLDGDAARTCLTDGTWSGIPPSCTPMAAPCMQLASPANGSLSIMGTGPGSTATYSCTMGFDLIGAPTRMCQADGSWSGPEPTCAVRCPCYKSTDLDRIQADLAAGGSKLCLVDSMGGGTTQTLFMSAHSTHRYAGEALENASLPGTHLACGHGCLDDTMNGMNECGALPIYQRTDNITTAQHATCRALVVPRCQ
jgi:hypothetical protein